MIRNSLGASVMNRKSLRYSCIAMGLSGVLLLAALVSPVFAEDRHYGHYGYYPYGEFRRGYGERRAVPNSGEARRMLRDYYYSRDLRIGDIRERKLFYEAEIRDRRGVIVDRVIIDRRTGRIRSMY